MQFWFDALLMDIGYSRTRFRIVWTAYSDSARLLGTNGGSILASVRSAMRSDAELSGSTNLKVVPSLEVFST